MYHAAMGVRHFYLYDQGSDDATLEAVAPFVAQGLVTFHRVSNQTRQHMFQALLLRKCFDDYGQYSEWIAHYDVDE